MESLVEGGTDIVVRRLRPSDLERVVDLDARVEKPSEEFITIPEGSDFGWPYCYHDPETDAKVLAPEYGGDGKQVGRCAEKDSPLLGFPAHWAPNDLEFYTGETFPGRYRGGAFVACDDGPGGARVRCN